jgi:hypothetical protein
MLTIKRVFISLSIFVFTISICLFSITGFSFAEGVIIADFDKSNVYDDLSMSTAFNVLDYPFYENKSARVINFVEYCYSYKVEKRADYGLYIYVYNPSGTPIVTRTGINRIQLAVGYDPDGQPIDYEKFSLKFCSVSEGAYAYLFYKFKVEDHRSSFDGKTILQRVNSNERRYDVSGIELTYTTELKAKDINVGTRYLFTGFALGYGSDETASSTLNCEVLELETVELDVYSTNYRTGISDLGVGHQWNVDTVYFSVPNSLLERYGRLQKIKAEWYEYKMKETVVTESSVLYNYIQSRIGISTVNQTGADPRSIYNLHIVQGGENAWNWAWNPVGINTHPYGVTCAVLYNIFDLNDISYPLSASVIDDYIRTYNKTYNSGVLPIEDQTISADLFQVGVDDGRTRGYNLVDVDSNELFDILDYTSTSPDFWDKVFDFGLWNAIINNLPNVGGGATGVSPIYKVTDKDIIGSDSTLSQRLLINENDVSEFKSFYLDSKLRGETTFLFRFAVTDYYSIPLTIEKNNGIFDSGFWEDQAYMSQETVFFDFDIIQLTFNRDGVYYVIPAVSNPIDIINSITPSIVPDDVFDWLSDLIDRFEDLLRLIITIILVGVLIVILLQFLPVILKILSYSFRFVGKSIKKLNKRSK